MELNLEQFNSEYDALNISQYLEPEAMRDNWSPHPFCIGNAHIKRYHIDTTKPCAMRINKETGQYANKRISKEGIIDTCKLSYDEHVLTRAILFSIKQTFDAQILEDALQEDVGELKLFFTKYNIVGFNFIPSEEFDILGVTKAK